MASRRPIEPDVTRFYRLEVTRSEQLSPNFRRVCVAGDALAELTPMGFDHWFRLFTLLPGQTRLRLPTATGRLWFAQWMATPAKERPHCANYTVRELRTDARELDIDFVIHRNADGEVEGRAALWAERAGPGEPLAILDQGLLFNPPTPYGPVLLVADESGLPAVEGILRSLPTDATGHAVIETPTAEDRRALAAPAGVAVHWVDRAGHPGAAAARATAELPPPDPTGYAFVVGEARLATDVRRHLVRGGLDKSRITFCGFWKR